MRLIGQIEHEKQALAFYSFLQKKGIECVYEPAQNQETHQKEFQIWIYKEEDIDEAAQLFSEFQNNPEDPKFDVPLAPPPKTSTNEFIQNEHEKQRKYRFRAHPAFVKRSSRSWFTKFIIALCVFTYLWQSGQQFTLAKRNIPFPLLLTSIVEALLFDYPQAFTEMRQFFLEHPDMTIEDPENPPQEIVEFTETLQKKPYWQGLYQYILSGENQRTIDAPMFVKIRQGEIWRLISPVILHGGFLHILFNMLWLILLGKQVEERIGIARYLLLSVFIGVVSNVAQYLVSGPFFMGYSGIITGLAGFIWIRQKIAPWEGYPLQRATFLFLGAFIVGMFLLQIALFVLTKIKGTEYPFYIANTAHIVGILAGIGLAYVPFLSKGR